MKETNLFIINDDVTDETVLAVLSALQTFETAAIEKNKGWNKTHRDNRELELETYLVCKERYRFIFERCLSTVKEIYSSDSKIEMRNYTYVADISISKAKKLAIGTDKPLALAIGILLGCEASTLADVSKLCTEYVSNTRMLLDPLIIEILPCRDIDEEGLDDRSFNCGMLPGVLDLERKINNVFRSKIIVGYSSFETYLGCCLNKPVVEVQLDSSLYKWSNKNYICITDEFRLAELVLKGIELALKAI